jgi:prepilin-type N-terminal cleavage/methylation domain-containing protein
MKKNNIKRKNKSGFTLVEMLCSVLLIGLISAGLARGVSLAFYQYKRSVRHSSSYQLFTTLQTIISNELKYTNKVTLDENNNVKEFYSVTYALKDNTTSLYILDKDENVTDGYGEVAFGDGKDYNYLLSSKSYSDSLGAKCNITYDENSGIFTVELKIGVNDEDNPYIEQTFSVRSIDNVSIQ